VNSRIVCTIVALACLGAVACASGPTTKDAEGPQAKAAEVDLDAEVEELVFGHDIPFVVRIDAAQWSSLSPYVRQLVDAAPLPDRERQGFEQLADGGLLSVLLEQFALEGGELIDRERSVWLTAEFIGAEDTLRAASMGLPWLPDSEHPMGYVARLVIPVTDAEAAAEAARQTLTPPRPFQAARVLAHDDHIQVDAVASQAPAGEVWEALDGPGAHTPRPTPALVAFLDDGAPVALYGRTTELRHYATAQLAYDVGRALENASPENVMRFHSMGAAAMLNQHIMAPASEREMEDFAVVSHAAGEAGVALETVATRTGLGRKLHQASASDISLPLLSVELLADEELLVDLTWQRNLSELAAASPIEIDEQPLSLDDLSGGANARQLRSLPAVIADAMRTMGWTVLVGLAHSPTYLPRLASAHMDDDLDQLVPAAARLRLVESTHQMGRKAGDEPGFQPAMMGVSGPPVAGALVLRLEASKDAVEAVLAPHTSMLEGAKDFGLTHRVIDGPDGGSELHIALGHALDDVVLDEREDTPPGVRADVNLAAIERLQGAGASDDASPMDLASPLHLRSTHTPGAAAWTLVSAHDAAEPAAHQTTLPPADNPPACLDQMVAEGMEIFTAMERLRARALSQRQRALEPYDAAAKACAEEAPEHAETLRWATGRARWMIARTQVHTLDAMKNTIEACKESQGQDKWACRPLENYDDEEPGAIREAATELLDEACERGDQIACDEKDALPALDTLTWRPQ
jgi:hypothetical protein